MGQLLTERGMEKGGRYFIGTGDDAWELAFLFVLAFHYGFDYGGVVGA